MTQQWMSQLGAPNDGVQANMISQRNLMLSPEGHAGFQAMGSAWSYSLLLLFAVGGGAMNARLLARRRRPEI
jgi:hypothetical protein